MKYLFPFFRTIDRVMQLLFTDRNISKPLLESSYVNFHDRVLDDCLKESIKGTTGEIHFIGFFETFSSSCPLLFVEAAREFYHRP